MTIRRCSFLIVLVVSLTVAAQVAPKKTITRAADLPSFTYTISGNAEDLLTKDTTFRPFAVQLRKDVESVLAEYDISDRSIRRELLHVLVALDVLEGKDAEARRLVDDIAALEEKPAQKYVSGLLWRSVLEARRVSRDPKSEQYRTAFRESLRRALDGMPFAIVENEIKQTKARSEIVSTPALLIGRAGAVIDPVLKKSGTLSSELANEVPQMRLVLVEGLPLRDIIVETCGGYLAAHKIEKPDIWAAREVTLEPGKPLAAVPVAVWDGGIDLAPFRSQLALENGKPAVLAYDLEFRPSSGELFPLPAAYREKLPQNMNRLKGFVDMQANLDTPEASAVKRELAQLKAEQVRPYLEELNATSNYSHGTHVAGIVLAGNPYARLVTGRFSYDYKMVPDPCPSRELSERTVPMGRETVAFFQRNKVRVVNMSFGESVANIERALELCGMGANTEQRKQMARELFDIEANGMKAAFSSAPEILFVAAGGNSNNDASFNEFIPASIRLPNLLAVGAVDKAGDEAPFTSYGPTIVAHANGYEVESYVPGGQKMKMSGTSMASPNAANLAAKILAVNPKLTPPQVIEIIRGTADTTSDGRRFLINPKKAIARAAASAPQPLTIAGAKSYVYKTVGRDELRLHVFKSDRTNPQGKPAIVFFFGGGFVSGSVRQFVPQAEYLAQRGMVAIVADYRVFSRHGTTPFEALADAKSAVRWVRAHHAELGIDPNRIAAAGGSAGGSLALSAAVFDAFDEASEDKAVSSTPNALVLFNPAVDATRVPPGMPDLFAGRNRDASPLHHLRAGLPPMVLLHGKSDAAVPYADVEHFCAESRALGNDCKVIGYEGASHGFFNPNTADGKWYRETLLEADRFLTTLGYLPKPTPTHIP